MNINEAIDACISYASITRSAHTARAYNNGLNHFLAHLEEYGISPDNETDQITIGSMIGFFDYLANQGFSKGTLRVYVASLRYLLDWLVIRDLMHPDYNEARRFEKAAHSIMRRREKQFPRIPEKGYAELMLEAVYKLELTSPELERNIALINFLYSSGCRANEVAGLRIATMDTRERSAIVTGKGDKERVIYYNRRAAEAINKYWNIRGYAEAGNPAFCRHDRGAGRKIKPITTATVRNIVEAVKMRAGLDGEMFTPHSFRHAFAIRMLRESKNLALVQDLLGHADPGATRVYATIYPDEMRDAYRKVYG